MDAVPRPRVGVIPSVRAGLGRTLLRYAAWGRATLRMLWRRRRDGSDPRALGIHLRELFEAVGGTGVKIGQQLSMRIDLLPYDVCRELATLSDAVPPFPTSAAVAAVERSTGAPLATHFAAFDPVPIGSASLACVYQARLHDGRKVAVKVKRPGVQALFASDLDAISWFTRALEGFGVVREDFFRNLREGLRDMFLEELDFAQEARLQRVFARSLDRDRGPGGPRWLSVPEVIAPLSGPDMLVSSFAEGVSCVEVLEAVEATGPAADAFLARHGIDPKRLARRVMTLSLWSQNEAALYHADPHPGNLIIAPGDRIVLVDFGACGWTNERTMLYGRRVIERLRRRDADGVAHVNLKQAEPLPHLDLRSYRRAAYETFRTWMLGAEDPEADWWARSTAPVWVEFAEHTQAFDVPMNVDVLRLIRCTLLYDTMSARLDPEIDVDLVHSYFLKAHRRRAKRGISPLRAPLVKGASTLGRGRGQALEARIGRLDRIELALPPIEVSRLTPETVIQAVNQGMRTVLWTAVILATLLWASLGTGSFGLAGLAALAGGVGLLLGARRLGPRLQARRPPARAKWRPGG